MKQQIQTIPNMQVTELQCASQPHDEGGVHRALRAERTLLRHLIADSVLLLEHAGRQRFGRDTASEGRVVMHVEFEEVEELVSHEVDGAIDLLLDTEKQFERSAGLVARREGYVLQLAVGVNDVLARLAEVRLGVCERAIEGDEHCAVQTGDGDGLAGVVASCFLKRFQRFLTAHGAGERCPEGTQRQEGEPGDSRSHCGMACRRSNWLRSDAYRGSPQRQQCVVGCAGSWSICQLAHVEVSQDGPCFSCFSASNSASLKSHTEHQTRT